jgi:hypothetical protein
VPGGIGIKLCRSIRQTRLLLVLAKPHLLRKKEKTMAQRGRKSAAALSIVRVEPAFRPKAPADLPAEQASEWKAIVQRMPAGWFGRESHGLLVGYLRHWWNAKLIAGSIDTFNPEWLTTDAGVDRFDQLSKVLQREQTAMAALAGKMRMTQSSRTMPG